MKDKMDKQTEELIIKFVFGGVRPEEQVLEESKKIFKDFTQTLEMSN
jgi:hypothetical protein